MSTKRKAPETTEDIQEIQQMEHKPAIVWPNIDAFFAHIQSTRKISEPLREAIKRHFEIKQIKPQDYEKALKDFGL